MSSAIFSTAYLPSIGYISSLINFPSVIIEAYENFQKQTIRNRCHILSANGIQTLTLPILHENKIKIHTKDIKICYRESWQRIHWSALCSAYNSSPFFEYYKDDLERIIFDKKIYLLDMNIDLLEWILKILKIKTTIKLTVEFHKKYAEDDFRFLSNKKNIKHHKLNLPYSQVFENKFGFTGNLSIVDLIFNTGNTASDYL